MAYAQSFSIALETMWRNLIDDGRLFLVFLTNIVKKCIKTSHRNEQYYTIPSTFRKITYVEKHTTSLLDFVVPNQKDGS